jgi:hypothetical protein
MGPSEPTQAPTAEAMGAAVAPLRDMLAADGYALTVEALGNGWELRIGATGDACADCLVPEMLLRTIVADGLRRHGIVLGEERLHVVYPTTGKR